jgi:hypothetical protein
MAETLEKSAQRIAAKGREALRERLREAFEEAAAAHADVLELDPERLEAMVERATDRADGLQWRRALATAATDELGIGLGEALEHPAVSRAQKLVGAPSYEEGLAAIAKGEPPPAGTGEPEPVAEESEPADEQAPAGDGAEPEEADLEIAVPVVYVQGLPKLEGMGELELRFSEDGLQIIRMSDRSVPVTLAWGDVDDIAVQHRRGRLRRRRVAARLVLTIRGRGAEFEAGDVDPEDLTRRLSPVVKRVHAKT